MNKALKFTNQTKDHSNLRQTEEYNTLARKPTAESETLYNNISLGETLMEQTISSHLVELEEHMEMLIKSLHGKKLSIGTVALDLWSFYFSSNVYVDIPALFLSDQSDYAKLSNDLFKRLLITVIPCYHSSFDQVLFKAILPFLNTTLINLHRTLLIVIDYMIIHTKMTDENKRTLMELIKDKKSKETKDHMTEARSIMKNISFSLSNLISRYEITSIGHELQAFYENLTNVDHEDINLFFQGEVLTIVHSFNTSDSYDDSYQQTPQSDYDIKTKPSSLLLDAMKSYSVNITHSNTMALTPTLLNTTNKLYSLVLDLDETLIHFVIGNDSNGKVLYRPYLTEFLQSVSKQFEVVVFTASVKEYADIILNLIEAKVGHKVFDHRFYREHTTLSKGSFIKDLRKLGRDLSKVVIVDNLSEAFEYQPDNGIQIASFLGTDNKDQCLLELSHILSDIVKIKTIKDIRRHLVHFNKDIKAKVSLISH